MNIPEIYLVEPYNAYTAQKGGRKKHWHEIVEEEALMQRIIAEQRALQEAQSRTLPPNSPNISTPTVAGNNAAGAGGVPVEEFFNPTEDVIDFSGTPLLGAGPLTVQFTNLTTTPTFDQYLWTFGDGNTSTDVSPVHLYQTRSSALAYTVSLQVTNSTTGVPGGIKIRNGYVSASIPTVTALFTYVTSSGPGPVTASFTNGSSTNSQTPPTLIYLWAFGDSTSSVVTSPTHAYANTGSFTASLQATGSYAIASMYTQSFFVPAPTLAAGFTYTTSSGPGPATASFTNTTTYNGAGSKTYLWLFGDATTSSLAAPAAHAYANTGSFTASLQVTESKYSITSLYTQSFFVAAPTLGIDFTITTGSSIAPSVVTLSSSLTYNGKGAISGRWGRGEFHEDGTTEYGAVYGPVISNNSYDTRSATGQNGKFTASLQITESSYGITAYVTHSFTLTLPSILAAFTFTTSSKSSESLATFVNTSTYVTSSELGYEGMTLLWTYGTSSLTSVAATAPPMAYSASGPYTASLQLTESRYGLTSYVTHSWRLV